MKKILIISESFYPSSAVGAVRPTKIAKYLTKAGYQVDVVTKYPVTDQQGKEFFHNLYTFDKQSKAMGEENSKVTLKQNKIHSVFYKKIYSFYHVIVNILSAKATVKNFNKVIEFNLSRVKYDAVISSFGPLTSLLCGMHYKKKHPDVKWICDFRDPVVVDIVPKFFHPYYKYLQNKACKKADVITTVSNGYFKRICEKKYSSKSYMIPNGYDLSDIPDIEEGFKSEKLTFAYAGILYNGKRDISPLFRALKELADDGEIDKNNISFQYAGKNGTVLMEQAKKYNMEDIVVDMRQMSRQECLKFQFSSDFLVLATWNYKGETGVFPGKILEYMLMKKPIVSLTNGNIPYGEVTQTIREGNFGIAYEESCDEDDFNKLKNYIKNQYDLFINSNSIEFNPNQDVVDRYNWNNLVKKFQEIL